MRRHEHRHSFSQGWVSGKKGKPNPERNFLNVKIQLQIVDKTTVTVFRRSVLLLLALSPACLRDSTLRHVLLVLRKEPIIRSRHSNLRTDFRQRRAMLLYDVNHQRLELLPARGLNQVEHRAREDVVPVPLPSKRINDGVEQRIVHDVLQVVRLAVRVSIRRAVAVVPRTSADDNAADA